MMPHDYDGSDYVIPFYPRYAAAKSFVCSRCGGRAMTDSALLRFTHAGKLVALCLACRKIALAPHGTDTSGP